MEKLNQFKIFLFQERSIQPLVLFRILFGCFMAFWCARYRHETFVYTYFVDPDFIFSYPFMEWLGVARLPQHILFILYKVMFASAVCVALGVFYRLAVILLFLSFGYDFFLDATHYNEHQYLMLVLSFLMIFLPANGKFSLDQIVGIAPKRETIAQWQIFILQVQVCLMYFFAGVTKLDPDWIRLLTASYSFTGYPGWTTLLFTFGGLISDFGLSVFLLRSKYRRAVLAWALLYHSLIKVLLDVGIFPYFSILSLILFVPLKEKEGTERKPVSNIILTGITVFLIIQIVMPLRHWVYPGSVNWRKEGDTFAWRIFSQADYGHADFKVQDLETGEVVKVPRLKGITLVDYTEMVVHPRRIWEYARYLRQVYQKEGVKNPAVYVDAFVSLNGRPFARLIDPDINLAEVAYPYGSCAPWILPHPDQAGTTGISWYNVGAFFEPAYQLAVIESEVLIPGDASLVGEFEDALKKLSAKFSVSRQELADRMIDQRQSMWEQGGPLLAIKEMFLFMNSAQANSLDELFNHLRNAYVLQI